MSKNHKDTRTTTTETTEPETLEVSMWVPPAGTACKTVEEAKRFFDGLPVGYIGSVPCEHAGRFLQACNFAQAVDFFAGESHQLGEETKPAVMTWTSRHPDAIDPAASAAAETNADATDAVRQTSEN